MNETLFDLPSFAYSDEVSNHYDPAARIVLYPGDTSRFLETLPNESIALIITSPPYNLGKDYEDRTSIEQYLGAQSQVIKQLYRIVRHNGSICWQVGNFVDKGEVYPLDIFYYGIFKKQGFHLRNRIIWRFGHGLHASKRFSGRYETILWFTKSDQYIFNLDPVRVPSKYPGKRHFKGPNQGKPSGNPLGKNPADIWEIVAKDWEEEIWDIPNVKANHPEKTEHPCQYPIELVERCILALTREDDWVFDPYAGVGTSLVAAILNGRRAMGGEKEAAYVEIARQRIRDSLNGVVRRRPVGKPVYQPTGNEKVARIPQEWKDNSEERLLEEKVNYP